MNHNWRTKWIYSKCLETQWKTYFRSKSPSAVFEAKQYSPWIESQWGQHRKLARQWCGTCTLLKRSCRTLGLGEECTVIVHGDGVKPEEEDCILERERESECKKALVSMQLFYIHRVHGQCWLFIQIQIQWNGYMNIWSHWVCFGLSCDHIVSSQQVASQGESMPDLEAWGLHVASCCRFWSFL